MKRAMSGFRRRLATLLVVCMIVTLLPVHAFGAVDDQKEAIPFDDEIVDEDAMFYDLDDEDDDEASPSDGALLSKYASPSDQAIRQPELATGSDATGGLDLSDGLPKEDTWWQAGSGKVTFTVDTNTLTLEDAVIDAETESGLELPSETMNLVLVGESTISGAAHGIRCLGDGEITIMGNGTLNAAGRGRDSSDDPSHGIGVGMLTVSEDAVVKATGGTNEAGSSFGIFVSGLEISENATVAATGGAASVESAGVFTSDKLAVSLAVADNAKLTASSSDADSYSYGIDADSIEITGGTVVAAAGVNSDENGDSAGIGAKEMSVSDAYVEASGNPDAVGYRCGILITEGELTIGSGGFVLADGADFPVGLKMGGAVDSTVVIDGGILVGTGTGAKGWSGMDGYFTKAFGILANDTSCEIFQDSEDHDVLEISHDLTIPEGCYAEIPEGAWLLIETGATLTNQGTLMNLGALIVMGTLVNRGEISGMDSISMMRGSSFKNEGKVVLSENMVKKPGNLFYDGNKKEVQVSFGELEFNKDNDYTVEYTPDNVNIGTVTATVTPTEDGGLTGEPVAVQYTIEPLDETIQKLCDEIDGLPGADQVPNPFPVEMKEKLAGITIDLAEALEYFGIEMVMEAIGLERLQKFYGLSALWEQDAQPMSEEQLCAEIDGMSEAEAIPLPLTREMKIKILVLTTDASAFLDALDSVEDFIEIIGKERYQKIMDLSELAREDPQPAPPLPEAGSDVTGGLDLSGGLPDQDISWKAGDGVISYAADTKTLALEDATITSDQEIGLYLPEEGFQMVLVGSSAVSGAACGVYAAGFSEEEAVIIRGDGTLNVIGGDGGMGDSVGIDGGWLVVCGDAVVDATGGSAAYSAGISVNNLKLSDRAVVTAEGGTAGSQSAGVMSNVTVSDDAQLTARGGEAANYSEGIIIYGSVTVTGGALIAEGGDAPEESIGIEAKQVNVSGGGALKALGDPGAGTSLGIYLYDGGMTVQDGIVYADGAADAIYMEDDTYVNMDGGILASAKKGAWSGLKDQITKKAGILLDGSSFELFSDTGNFELHHDLTIPEDCDAEIPEGLVMTVAEKTTLTNDGTLTNHGIFGVSGSVAGKGSFENAGKIILSKDMIEAPADLVYDGSEKEIGVWFLGIKFQEGTDYTVVYTPDNVNEGTFTAVVTPAEGGGLTGASVSSDVYTITHGGGTEPEDPDPPVNPDPPVTPDRPERPDRDDSESSTDTTVDSPIPESVITTTQAGIQIAAAADESGMVSVTVPEDSVEEAVRMAQAAGGNETGDGITVSVEIHVQPGQNAGSMSVTLPEKTADQLIGSGVSALRIQGPAGTFGLDTAAIKTVRTKAPGDICIQAQRLAAGELPESMRALLGGRPAYRYTVTGGGKAVTDLQGGTLSVSIPYMPGPGEDAGKIRAYQADAEGAVQELAGSSYDFAGKTVSARTGHVSIIGVGDGTKR